MNTEKAIVEIPPHITVRGGQVVTTSLDIAEKFGKRHDDVLKKINARYSADVNGLNFAGVEIQFFRDNFRKTSYLDNKNERRPMYEITRDGFSFLVMGFTGKKASEWKIKYIAAFNAMEQVISRQANTAWQELRRQGKATRLDETDTIKQFVEYATRQGSTKAQWYYKHITAATHKALFIIKDRSGQPFRDMLDNMQLSFLNTAEYVARNAINDGMRDGLFYKDIYALAKSKIEAVAATVGVTEVISNNPQLKLIK